MGETFVVPAINNSNLLGKATSLKQPTLAGTNPAVAKGAAKSAQLSGIMKGLNIAGLVDSIAPETISGNKIKGSEVLSKIPGLGWITLGINEAFGSNVNQEAVDTLLAQTEQANNNIIGSKSIDSLASAVTGINDLNKSAQSADLGTQGWFNHDVDNARDNIMSQIVSASNNIGTTAGNIQRSNIRQSLGQQFGCGGYLFEDGGIHINPKNKGKFTASAKRAGMGVQEFAKHVLANKEDYSSTQVKRANFARNASKWKHPDGGFLNDYFNGVTEINAGGTHEMNPNEGVPVGIAPDGNPNLVEEGEVIYKDYVFSNRIPVPNEIRNKYKLRDKLTFAEAFKELEKESKERPNDPISQNGLDAIAIDLASSQEIMREKKNKNKSKSNKFADGSILRYAEPFGSVVALMDNLFDPWEAPKIDALTAPQKVDVAPINDYIDTTPFDRNYWTNQLLVQQAASRRGLTSDAARLAADYNANTQMGALARQGEEFNLNDKYKVAEFNRGTNQFNNQMALNAAQINQQLKRYYDRDLMSQAQANASMAMSDKQARDAAKGQNISNIFTSLGNIGKENIDRENIQGLVDTRVFGMIVDEVAKRLDKAAYGGRLNKKKKGLTF